MQSPRFQGWQKPERSCQQVIDITKTIPAFRPESRDYFLYAGTAVHFCTAVPVIISENSESAATSAVVVASAVVVIAAAREQDDDEQNNPAAAIVVVIKTHST